MQQWGVTVAEALDLAVRALPEREGIPDPRREGLWLLARAWGCSELAVRLAPGDELPPEVAARFAAWVERRAAGEPAHHLTGSCPFWGRDFLVSPAVLVPRPETELIVDRALGLDLPGAARVLDVGTGSGCLAVSLACERPGWTVSATDRSPAALAVARDNAAHHAAAVPLVLSDLAAALAGPFDLVVANLPYIPSEELARLPAEVRHDPAAALDGGADGLDLVRRLIADLPRVLARGGIALLELGEGQAGPAGSAAAAAGLAVTEVVRDLGGCERVLVLGRG